MRSLVPVSACVVLAFAAPACRSGRDELRERIFHRTDHGALVAACREVLARRGTYRPNPEVIGPAEAEVRRMRPDPADPTLPSQIRDLSVRDIVTEDDFVRLILTPDLFARVDIVVFRAGADEDQWARLLGKGGERVAPGLWYYELEEE